MKNVVVIGGLGNIGCHLLEKIKNNDGLNITCIARFSKKNELKAKRLKKIRFVWADIIKQDILPYLKNADIILNLAAILPPQSENDIKYSNKVNYIFVKKILPFLDDKTKFIFLSTSGVSFCKSKSASKLFHKNYLMQKKKAEDAIIKGGHHYVIIRLPFVFDSVFPPITPSLFEIPLDNKMEFIHKYDVVDCICKTFKSKTDEIINLGGNCECQITYREYLQFCFAGYVPTSDDLFTQDYYPTDWIHSSDMKQKISFKTMVKEVYEKNPFMFLYRKIFRAYIIKQWEKQSPYARLRDKTAAN